MDTQADFILVGAGTAGSALAEALTRDGRTRVLMVEAGPAPSSPFVDIPAGFTKLFRSRLDWNFQSEPDPRTGRSVYIPRGRMLGGSANLNAQIHQWGHPSDFAAWTAAGATGWSWDDVAPVYRALECLDRAEEGRGADGPLHVASRPQIHPLSRAFVAAAGHAAQSPGYNNHDPEGAWVSEVTQRAGRRFSTWHGLLKPAMRRANLETLTGAYAEAIVFDGHRASGLRVMQSGRRRTLSARRGVIVCAGAFGSPHLLMRSGIGKASHLQSFGIDVVRDLPGVGANLHDHPMACPTFATQRRDTLKSAESPGNLMRYILGRRGALASNIAEAIAFSRSMPGLPAPDVEFLFAPVEWRGEGLAPPKHHGFTIAVILLRPRSRGSVTLLDPAPSATPRIDLALLCDADGMDRRAMIAAVRAARDIAGRAPLAASCTGELAPGAEARSDEALSAWLDREIQTVYHPGGTCSIGTVVDSRLAVHGTTSLWVADASVMPSMVSGHPNLTAAMIGARAAGFIGPA